ncbi:MAG: hypothetical protein AUJ57_08510 [Zetaproteobacteria bacterium CG1_02_53_45]|nr:MAG: hypothetical protein AUJ57_08510 [Zetaproteobacteria bacterium CG1_02_53_45]
MLIIRNYSAYIEKRWSKAFTAEDAKDAEEKQGNEKECLFNTHNTLRINIRGHWKSCQRPYSYISSFLCVAGHDVQMPRVHGCAGAPSAVKKILVLIIGSSE